ncbi:hypothetical protein GW932_00960 [archaeon]|nr:hypothetical protein [archaeon]
MIKKIANNIYLKLQNFFQISTPCTTYESDLLIKTLGGFPRQEDIDGINYLVLGNTYYIPQFGEKNQSYKIMKEGKLIDLIDENKK